MSATGTVGLDMSSTTNGQKKSFQACTNVIMNRTAMAGRATGSTMLQKMRSECAPSTRPASTSSSGSASERYCRMKNTPTALTSVGKMTAGSCCDQPSSDIIMNSGTTPSCGGTIMVPITSMSRMLRPLKRSLAKAKPASVAKNTVERAITPATIVLLIIALPMAASSHARARLLNRFGPGRNGGGVWLTRVLSVEAATIVQYSGKMDRIAMTASRT